MKTWVDLDSIMLNEIKPDGVMQYEISLIYGIQTDKTKLIDAKERRDRRKSEMGEGDQEVQMCSFIINYHGM